MAVGLNHTLFCDQPGCRSKVTIRDTRNAAHARQLARTRSHWRCDTAGDYCPHDATAREVSHTRPVRRETASHTSNETSHPRCDTRETR